jgi:serine/threonine-protein kinase
MQPAEILNELVACIFHVPIFGLDVNTMERSNAMGSAATGHLAAQEEESSDLLVGTPYRALGALGHGGMGEVIEAEHRALRKRVVVKLLHQVLAKEPRMVDRMRVEAQALAALSSPNVVAVTDLGETATGRPFVVMERLQGRTLDEELKGRGGALPLAEAIGIVRQVLAGLAAAHRIGIIHRDVKLSNIFVCEAPTQGGARLVKVLDFGIAKVLPRDDSPTPVPVPRYATETGALVGSPRTVSPEQARCQKVDARTDIYAAGLMLYTLIVGQGPFAHAKEILDLLNAHIREPPVPPSHRAKQYVPAELDLAILKSLAKKPEHRFQTADAFSEELGRVEAVVTGSTQPFALMPEGSPTAGGAVVAEPSDESQARTLVRPAAATPSRPEAPVASSGGLSADFDSWFGRAADDRPLKELPSNLTPPEQSGWKREFFFAIVVSTVAFGLIAAIIFRYLGYGGR